jgi:diaminopimelate epimerase
MTKLSFAKYSGNGNDFIILDHTEKLTSDTVQRLCHRQFGIGADGVVTVGTSAKADAKMRIFNADGGEAEMCGNGLRCLVTYLDDTVAQKKDAYTIETINALYKVIRKGLAFAIEMSEIKDKNLYNLSVFKDYPQSFYVNTGVPHLIFLTSEAQKVDIKKEGAYYRYHSMFPKGTNVTFVEVLDRDSQKAYARTYERGVEDETFSCGTGLTATALALNHWFGWKGDILLKTKGGNQMVSINDTVLYSGEVIRAFQGEVIV